MGGSRPRAQNTGKKWIMDWIDDFLRQENTVDDKEHNTHKKRCFCKQGTLRTDAKGSQVGRSFTIGLCEGEGERKKKKRGRGGAKREVSGGEMRKCK